MTENFDYARRFGGVSRLYGMSGLAKLQAAHIVVVGIGGVGSWAAEALARNAVGFITLIDLDNIAESNVNRQIHAVNDNFGQAKISAMHARILSINPRCKVREIEDFVSTQNAQKMLNFQFDCLVDCVDDAAAKAVLAALCKTADVPMLMSGSAGGRLDPTRLKVADLSAVTNDKLLAKVRNVLRRDYAFPKASQTQKSAKLNTNFNTKFNTMFNISCVYSDEAVMAPETQSAQDTICALEKDTSLSQAVLPATLQASQASQESQESQAKNQSQAITGLNCAGYGSSVCVTAPMGFALAQLAINEIIKNRTKNCIKHTE